MSGFTPGEADGARQALEVIERARNAVVILQDHLSFLGGFGHPAASITPRVERLAEALEPFPAELERIRQDLLPTPTGEATTIGAATGAIVFDERKRRHRA